MAILTFPTILPETQDFGIKYNTQVSSSQVSGVTQTVEMPGARWVGSTNYRDMTLAESADLKAFMMELRGSAGRFYYGDITHTSPFNTVTGSPTVESSSTRRIIRVTLGASSPQFSRGDYIQIGTGTNRELKMVMSSASAGGDAYDLTIEPMIRMQTYVGESVVYTNPTGVFLLTTSEQARWATRGKALLSDMSLEFIEVFS